MKISQAQYDKHAKAETLHFEIMSGKKMTTRQMCIALGWQGGTIWQVAEEVGLPVETLLAAQP